MTPEHPITPPPELVERWIKEPGGLNAVHVATQAARWGADQQLNADCEWLHRRCLVSGAEELRAAMRPKPPSLAEQALTVLEQTTVLLMPVTGPEKIKQFEAIRTALERLQELEKGNE